MSDDFDFEIEKDSKNVSDLKKKLAELALGTEPIKIDEKEPPKWKKKKAEENSKPQKISKIKKHYYLIRKMASSRKFGCYIDPNLNRVPILIKEDRTVSPTNLKVIADEALAVGLGEGEDYHVFGKEAEDVAIGFLRAIEPIPAPVDVVFKSDDRLAFSRLAFDRKEFIAIEDMPWTATILNRMNDYQAFCAWIGSLFHEDGYRHQYVWLHGPGGDGKSTITNAILEAFAGSAVTVRIPDHHTRRFFNASIVGKRLAIFSDAESSDFTTSGHFKELTGDDYILVEEKYKSPYQAKNNCKFLFISNEAPTVRNRESDRRRCIPISIDPPHGDLANMGPKFTELVRAEAPLFINFCLDMYDSYMDFGIKPITLNEAAQEALQNHADDTDSLYEEIFNEHFRIEPSARVRCSDLNARVRSCKANTKKFREWVEVRLGIDMTRIHDSKTDQKYHHGIKIIQAVLPS